MERTHNEVCIRCQRWYVNSGTEHCITCLDDHPTWAPDLGCGDLGCDRPHAAMDHLIDGNDPTLSAANQVLCNGEAWAEMSRADLLAELRLLARKVLAEAKGTEP